MSYVALYRKYRPQNFSQVVGQSAICQALKNALLQNKLVHAYLFSGPRGTGKTSMAKILAKSINCLSPDSEGEPCNKCAHCMGITDGSNMDVFEIDAASNRGIDEIRNLRDNVNFSPVSCRYKVYIIDEVHMLTIESFNALLKTLEEPPAHIMFILATTEPQKIPVTILSRCQRYDFRKLTTTDLSGHLQQVAEGSGIAVTQEALEFIAAVADGAMRDALSLLEQAQIAASPITLESLQGLLGSLPKEALRNMLNYLGKNDIAALLLSLQTLLEQGKDIKNITYELIEYIRAMLIFKAYPNHHGLTLTDDLRYLEELGALFTQNKLIHIANTLQQVLKQLKVTSKHTLTLELAFMELCHSAEPTAAIPADLLARIERLERRPLAQAPSSQDNSSQTAAAKVRSLLADTLAPSEPTESLTNFDKDSLYKALLNALHKANKRAVLACLNFAKAYELTDNRLLVSFNTDFACERVLKEDFLKLIESTLHKITGVPIAFVALKEGQLPDITQDKADEKLVSVAPEEIEELDECVQKAYDIFGGQVNKIEG